ncbi:MAG: DUF2889 domain-containing protein [Deltaproteobacteria bacterium]|nr:DUF2889 domain-containing protein [Deltaproteobacteria bacterium]
MKLSVAGHPLHTRSLTVTASQRGDGRQELRAAVLDLRKCGFVPVAGFLQSSGIVHHMTLEGVVDPATRVLEHIEGGQPTRAFDPSRLTQGECCSDPLPRLASLAGEKLDDRFAGALRQVFGGSLGCSHLVTLAQLLASGIATSLDWNAEQPAATRDRRPGERIFQRAVEIDGFELDDGRIQLTLQLTDLHFRLSALVDVAKGMRLGALVGYERRRDYDGIGSARFVDRSHELRFLEGQDVMRGVSKGMLGAFRDDPEDRPFLDAQLMLAPGFVQCLASLSERWLENAVANPSLLGVCGRPDSCYMWRNGGPIQRAGQDWDESD